MLRSALRLAALGVLLLPPAAGAQGDHMHPLVRSLADASDPEGQADAARALADSLCLSHELFVLSHFNVRVGGDGAERFWARYERLNDALAPLVERPDTPFDRMAERAGPGLEPALTLLGCLHPATRYVPVEPPTRPVRTAMDARPTRLRVYGAVLRAGAEADVRVVFDDRGVDPTPLTEAVAGRLATGEISVYGAASTLDRVARPPDAAVPALERALDAVRGDHRRTVAEAVYRALRRNGSDRAVGTLIRHAFGNPSADWTLWAAAGRNALAAVDSVGPARFADDIARAYQAYRPSTSVNPLTLHASVWRDVAALVERARAVPRLEADLQSDDPDRYGRAIPILTMLGADVAGPLLLDVLADTSRGLAVRARVLHAGAGLAYRPFFEELARLVRGDSRLRDAAAGMIGRGPADVALPALLDYVGRDPSYERRRRVAPALRRLGAPGATRFLLDLYADAPTEAERQGLLWELMRTEDRAVTPLAVDALGAADVTTANTAALVLRGLADPTATSALVRALDHPTGNVRAHAAEALAAIGTPEALGAARASLPRLPEFTRVGVENAIRAAEARRGSDPP